ncbi:unnamed protein product [Gongylonema pulchrum]|uniref:Uncharacterized protein n=1 Tax=Gongylonema pulchrum TaxID=637853 RepID=A0A183EPV7_9BILA|nr:unnamed protein product [Gongylonema pulchrum]
MELSMETDELVSNVSMDDECLSGSERIVHGVAHKPLLFAFLYNKRNKELDCILRKIELKTKISREKENKWMEIPVERIK